MKILFVMRTAAHFPYHLTTVDALVARGHDVTLLFDPTWNKMGPIGDRALQEWLAGGPKVGLGTSRQRSDRWRGLVFATREMRSYAHYCRRGPEAEFYRRRWQRYMPARAQAFAETALGRFLFRRTATQRVLNLVERLVPPDPRIVESLQQARPDCVVASPIDMRFSEEVEYVKAARALKIPSVVPVLSWDNLATKGLFHARPDLVLAWHDDHKREARSIHAMPADRVAVTGSPFFDKWFDPGLPIRSRSVTCRRLGIDPARPYVLYLGSSVNISPDESGLVGKLLKSLRSSDAPAVRRHQLVFKPHPANLRALPRLDTLKVPVWPREPGLPDTRDGVREFREALHHATCVVGINTTGMVDALLCDRPTIALLADEYTKTQSYTAHFRRMKKSGALYTEASSAAVAARVGGLAAGDDPRAAARQTFMKTFARPRGLGAAAGEAAARAIELLMTGRSGPQIEADLDSAFASRPAPPPPSVEQETLPQVMTEAAPSRRPPEPRRPWHAVLRESISAASQSPVFAHYQRVRDLVLTMMEEGADYDYSAYWREEIAGFDYLFDASPLVIAKLREHTYHVTGLKSYEYRDHHALKSAPFDFKLARLKDVDRSNLFIPEAPELGGFGHVVQGALVNVDTLKFYECLIALDRAGVLTELRDAAARPRILEIGAGWGGFAYQLKTTLRRALYVIVDLPPTLLFSMTYLKATFPDAKMRVYGETPTDRLFADLDEVDFVFLPAHAFPTLAVPTPDLAVNIASFQEMTSAQVAGYVNTLADRGCRLLYSLNRDRSPYNAELSTVSEIMEARYRLERLDVLPVPYTTLTWKPGKTAELSTTDYRHQLGRLR